MERLAAAVSNDESKYPSDFPACVQHLNVCNNFFFVHESTFFEFNTSFNALYQGGGAKYTCTNVLKFWKEMHGRLRNFFVSQVKIFFFDGSTI